MTARVLDGSAVARSVLADVADRVTELTSPPGLATVLVGDDPASATYVRTKRRRCVEVGMRDVHRHLDADVTQSDLERVVEDLAEDPEVTGILVQLPLPAHLDAAPVLARVPAEKDVDGLTVASAGRLAQGLPGLRPCTPSGVLELIDAAGTDLGGANTVVVGRSGLVGKPMAQLLLARHATVTTCHSRTRDLSATCRQADVLVVAAGVAGLVGADAVRPGATVIDVGIHRTAEGRLRGDVDTDAVLEVAAVVTPVPGGVGPMTIAMLLRNTFLAGRLQEGGATPG